MSLPFKGKIIFITGAASGIGRATAIALHKLGATLALADINDPGLVETRSLCTNADLVVLFRNFDISDSFQCKSFVSTVVNLLARPLDHVFNCAGINPTALKTEEITDEYYEKMMGCNLKGLFNITRACIPYMREYSGSTFVNVSSICGTSARPGFAVYCATKFGIIGFSQAMALELGPRGIRTNIIAPGYIDTPTNSSVVAGEESVEASAKEVSIGRMGTADEIASVVVFLMGDGAKYMNGSVVDVNGGLGGG